FSQRARPLFPRSSQNHLAHRIDAIALEKHVLGPAEADALGAKSDRVSDLLRRISVGANAQCSKLVHPLHQLLVFAIGLALLAFERLIDKYLNDLRGRSGDFSG